MSKPEFRSAPATGPSGIVRAVAQAESDDLSLFAVLNFVLRQRVTILLCTVALVGLTVIYVQTRPSRFTSSATFLPQQSENPSQLAGLAAQFGVPLPTGGGGESPALYVDLLRSRRIMEQVADVRYDVRTDSGPVQGTLHELWGRKVRDSLMRRDAVLKRLNGATSAGFAPKTSVVSIRVRSERPELSRAIVEQYITAITRFNLERRQGRAAAERRFTEERLTEAKAELRSAENQLQVFLQQNREFRNSPELNFRQERLTREVALRQQLYSALAQSFDRSRIDEVRDTPVITVIDRPTLPSRRDSRGGAVKVLVALILGLGLGVVVGFLRERLSEPDAGELDDATEFARLRREVLNDLRHPLRALRRGGRRDPGAAAPTA